MLGHSSKQNSSPTDDTKNQSAVNETSLETTPSADMFHLSFSSGQPSPNTVQKIMQMQSLYGNTMVQRLIAEQHQPTEVSNQYTSSSAQKHLLRKQSVYNNYSTGEYRIQRTGDGEEVPAPSGDLNEEGFVDVAKRGIVKDVTGANVRDQPVPEEEGSSILVNLPQNTPVMILRENPSTSWYAIRVMEGDYAGQSGYVANWLIRDDLPDPNAILYDVQGEDMLGTLVQNHPQYSGYAIETGDDARSLVMAVYVANQNGNGVRLVGEAEGGLVNSALDTADVSGYREEMRQIYQTIQLIEGEQIWLPSITFVESLKDSGVIPERPDWMNTAIEAGKGIGGFTAGIVDGLVSSVIDLIVGVFELAQNVVDGIISVFTGEALAMAQELYSYFETLTADPQKIRELAANLVEAIVSGIIGTVDTFLANWNAALIFDRWYFRGKVVGYILAEIAMMYLSGGASAAKWLDKLGDVGKFFKRVLSRIDDAMDALPDLPGRSRDRTPDIDPNLPRDRTPDVDPDLPRDRTPDVDNDDTDMTERIRVLAQARTIAETHDTMDSPVSLAITSLNVLKRGNPWINEFYSVRTSPGHYRLLMRSDIVDNDYTPDDDDNGTNLEQLDERARTRLTEIMEETGLSDEQVGRMMANMDNPNETIVGAVQQLNNMGVSPEDMTRFIEALPDGQRGTVFNEIREFRLQRQSNDSLSVDDFIEFRRQNPLIPANWNRFDQAQDQQFIERLRQFQGEDNLDLTRPSGFAGGEGQLFFSSAQPDQALKRWFSSRLDDMPESVRLLDDAAAAIDNNADIARHLDVVRISDRGPDWIVRDFVSGTDPLRDVISSNPAAQAARDAVLPHLSGGVLDDINSKFMGTISENLHWSPTRNQIIILDMQ